MAAGSCHKTFKSVLVGDTDVGKSGLARRLTTGKFPEHGMASTIGAGLYKLDLEDGSKVNLWDTAGQERYRGLLSVYYHGASIVLLCFDLQRFQPESLKGWAKDIASKIADDVQVLLVGTKAEGVARKEVTHIREETFDICVREGLVVADAVCVTDARTNKGIADLKTQLQVLLRGPEPASSVKNTFVVKRMLRLGMVESEGAPSPGCC